MKIIRQVTFTLFALAIASSVLAHSSTQITGKVVGVLDGDTIQVLTGDYQNVRVRLAEIDAPEKSQDFGQVSKKSLSDLVYGKTVTVRVTDIDKYGRSIGRVSVGNADVNIEQVSRGLAWCYTKYSKDPAVAAAEKKARGAKVGLWSQANPTPPWDFRHGAGG